MTVERWPPLSWTTVRWTGSAPKRASRLLPAAFSWIAIVTRWPAGIVSLDEPTKTTCERILWWWRLARTAVGLPLRVRSTVVSAASTSQLVPAEPAQSSVTVTSPLAPLAEPTCEACATGGIGL